MNQQPSVKKSERQLDVNQFVQVKRKSGRVRSGQVRSGQVKSSQVRSGQVRSGQVRSGQVKQIKNQRRKIKEEHCSVTTQT